VGGRDALEVRREDQPDSPGGLVHGRRSGFTGVIALDGPSGTGKSSVARKLAVRLSARYLDTGAMYRAATVAVLDAGASLDDAAAIAEIVGRSKISITTDPEDVHVEVDGTTVDGRIREQDVTTAVSAVSAVAEVRTQLVDAQRELIGDGGIVVEGRDIGTVVWPAAAPKIYLTADAPERARRRAAQVGDADVTAVENDLARRDSYDSSRTVSPLASADDALRLDTTELTLDEVVDVIYRLAITDA
jgi:cytidylate kinase